MRFRDWPKLPLVLIVLMFALGAAAYPSLPARIPTHWGPSGIDAWSPKSFLSVFQLPMMAIGLYLLLVLAPFLDPKRRNLLESKRYYQLVLDLVVALFFVIEAGTVAAAFRPSLPVDRVILVGVGVMLAVIGNFLGRVKQNWTMGARMPWTLEDPEVWRRTNVLTGRLFMVAGVLGILGAFLPGPWHIVLMLVPTLALVPVIYVYAFVQYRRRHPEQYADAPGR